MAHGNREIEIKLAASNAAAARARLLQAGFRLLRRRVLEVNAVFDTPARQLRRSAQLIRVREAGRVVTLTYKGPPAPGRHKSREELELRVSEASAMSAILERLRFRPVFRYEKYRTEYREKNKNAGLAMLDETPVGVFLELEGDPAWIDRTARRMGFQEKDYITGSYGSLYLDWCKRHRVKPGDMVF